ncbi:efflux RND transporter periplasmic adaptor subunit [Thiomonas bhubaneswarensis]|uniref:RND family efflux transporter, MFP subunit n=1 Tax=Thiomonas bhubaneswarensis TaxID=339866 RepID=A0A0K6HU16_9BURK|nr:efflux RND transporter periplasmic adaptor subunit [Thiomonas bhubaneswarensis]CUA94394.1 RND family efflux transporter, MFP subunit [Thiomonas bhubaneswarensis]
MSPIRFSRTPLARVLSASVISLAFVCAPISAQAAESGVIAMSLDQQTALGVRLAPVQPMAAAQIELPARVAVPPSQQAMVSAPAAGLVTRLMVNPGDQVKKGQPLLELSSPQIAQLQRERSEAASRHDLAQRQLQRDTVLVNEGIAPAARLEAARANSREAQAMLAERDLALKLAAGGTALNGVAVLRAPIAGTITEATALPGQRVDMAAPLFRIAQQGQLWLEIDASPQQAAMLQPGATVTVPAQQAQGVVQAKATALNAGQSVLIRVRITQPGSLQAGGVVQARLNLPAQAGVWRLPPAAVTQIGGRDAVLVMVKEGFRIVPVTVAGRLNDAVMVRGGLKAGDKVAATGVVAIKAAAGEVAP